LKATHGNSNYALPDSLDLGTYRSVVVYCRSFSVIFGYANLSLPDAGGRRKSAWPRSRTRREAHFA
jgi:hypothetical protein